MLAKIDVCHKRGAKVHIFFELRKKEDNILRRHTKFIKCHRAIVPFGVFRVKEDGADVLKRLTNCTELVDYIFYIIL